MDEKQRSNQKPLENDNIDSSPTEEAAPKSSLTDQIENSSEGKSDKVDLKEKSSSVVKSDHDDSKEMNNSEVNSDIYLVNSSTGNLENNLENSSENNLENSSENNLENNLENSSEINLENNLENNLESSSENSSENNLENSTGSNLENISKDGSEDVSKDGSDDNSKNKVKSKFNNLKHRVIHNKIIRKLKKSWDGINHAPMRNIIIPTAFFVGIFLYLELMTHILLYQSIDIKIIYPILFALPVGAFFSFITGLFNHIMNKIMIWILTIGLCLIFCLQMIYYNVFKVFFSLQSLGMAGDAISEFGSDVVEAIQNNFFGMILLLLPIVALAVLMDRFYDWDRREIKKQGILLAGAVTFQLFAILSLLIFGKGDYTPYDLYYKTQILDLSGKQLGILTMTRLDIIHLLEGESELVLAETDIIDWEVELDPTNIPTPIPTLAPEVTPTPVMDEATPTPPLLPTPTPIDTSPNIMDIDFYALAEKEKDDTIGTLHKYFASVVPTNKNEYTGMFEGYNLILITAEGFSPYAVHEEKTPTLYKLVNEGFIFNNFYTALWQTSTSDGEFVPLTGLIPIGTRSMYRTRDNLLPFTLGHQFRRQGIDTKAYHNHTYTYYQRDKTHPNLGYDYKGVGNGVVLEHDVWPNSDLEMINATVDEYIGQEPFHVYYLTVSGHMNYTFVGNSMSHKNKALVEDLPYSSDAKAYLASQMELDMALNELIKRLEEAGVAQRTVIALSADHYPYGWEKERLDELAGHEVDPYFEIYRNHFILWNPGMEENVVVEEPCSSLDILPTLSNLFGLEYDSRLLMGQDIFSDAPPIAILSNRSFITDKVMYNSETRETILLTDEELPEDYIKKMNKQIKNMFSVSDSIVKRDYYRYVFPEYE